METPLSEVEAKFITEKHLELWNEKNEINRRAVMNDIYAPDIEMTDRHFIATGYTEVDGFVSGLQTKNPEGRFSPTKPIEFHHNLIRLFWQNGSAAKPHAVTGMDLFVIENGKVQKLYVFVDPDQ